MDGNGCARPTPTAIVEDGGDEWFVARDASSHAMDASWMVMIVNTPYSQSPVINTSMNASYNQKKESPSPSFLALNPSIWTADSHECKVNTIHRSIQ
jgi:hypothetical protein